MDLMEYQARSLFEEWGLPVLKGFTTDTAETLTSEELSFPLVVKAQVATGGRGKLGGIRMADNKEELKNVAAAILGMDIKGHIVEKVMITEKAEIAKELYLSIMLDRNAKKHIILFSPCGGMDIEQTAKENPDKIFKLEIDPLLGYNPSDGMYLGKKAELDNAQQKQLSALIAKLYTMCKVQGCMLAEINPLAITKDGNLLALDAKVSVDDSMIARHENLSAIKAAQKQEPLVAEAASYKFLYIPCDKEGDVVIMSNGSGMLMSCIDHVTRNNRTVSAVLDMGGGATADRIEHAIRILFSTPGAKILFINIFGGITRCDEVAAGIRNAVEKQGIDKPIVVRFEGTNKEKGLEIINGLKGVTYVDGLLSGVEEIVRCS